MKRFILSLALLLPMCVQAQSHHEIGLMAGVSNYYGDLQDKLFASDGYKPMGGIVYKYFMNPHVGIRFGATYFAITAADSLNTGSPVKQARNLSFSNNMFEVHGGLELNMLPIDLNRFKVTPYIFAGVAVFYNNPYATDPNGNKTYLRALSTEGQGLPMYPDRKQYKLVNVAFPIGGGMKFLIGKTLVVTTELGFRYTTTDYLDDASRSYVNLDSLTAYRGKLAAQMSYRGHEAYGTDRNYYPDYKYQRGDSKSNDWYWYGGVSICVYFRAFGNPRDYIQAHCPRLFKVRTPR